MDYHLYNGICISIENRLIKWDIRISKVKVMVPVTDSMSISLQG